MSNAQVTLVTKVGTELFPIGKMHAAQARKLVKMDLGAWQDGKVIVAIRPHLGDMLYSNDHGWHGPHDGVEVSTAEMDRRKAWFKDMLMKFTTAKVASVGTTSQIEEIQKGLRFVKETQGGILDGIYVSGPALSVDPEGGMRHESLDDPELTAEEVAGFFGEEEAPAPEKFIEHEDMPPNELPNAKWHEVALAGMWKEEPDVKDCFSGLGEAGTPCPPLWEAPVVGGKVEELDEYRFRECVQEGAEMVPVKFLTSTSKVKRHIRIKE